MGKYTERGHVGQNDTPPKVRPLSQGKFFIDVYGAELIEGWTDGDNWNGWATPFFELPQAQRILELHNKVEPINPQGRGRAWYDANRDCFYFITEGTDQDVEEYCGFTRDVDGQPLRLYGIGT